MLQINQTGIFDTFDSRFDGECCLKAVIGSICNYNVPWIFDLLSELKACKIFWYHSWIKQRPRIEPHPWNFIQGSRVVKMSLAWPTGWAYTKTIKFVNKRNNVFFNWISFAIGWHLNWRKSAAFRARTGAGWWFRAFAGNAAVWTRTHFLHSRLPQEVLHVFKALIIVRWIWTGPWDFQISHLLYKDMIKLIACGSNILV